MGGPVVEGLGVEEGEAEGGGGGEIWVGGGGVGRGEEGGYGADLACAMSERERGY